MDVDEDTDQLLYLKPTKNKKNLSYKVLNTFENIMENEHLLRSIIFSNISKRQNALLWSKGLKLSYLT